MQRRKKYSKLTQNLDSTLNALLMQCQIAVKTQRLCTSDHRDDPMTIWYKVSGALVVAGCVVGMAICDMILKSGSLLCCGPREGFRGSGSIG